MRDDRKGATESVGNAFPTKPGHCLECQENCQQVHAAARHKNTVRPAVGSGHGRRGRRRPSARCAARRESDSGQGRGSFLGLFQGEWDGGTATPATVGKSWLSVVTWHIAVKSFQQMVLTRHLLLTATCLVVI